MIEKVEEQMNRKRTARLCMIAGMAAITLGCSSVSLTDVWVNPTYSNSQVNNILVAGLAHRPGIRSNFEYQLQHEFNSRGVSALTTVERVPEGERIDNSTLDKYFATDRIDAVLVTSLVSAETVTEWVPGNTYVAPAGHYSTWHGHYAARYEVYQEPGYLRTSKEFVLESNLYDVNTGKLIWRGLSKAVDPQSAMEVIDDLSKMLVSQLGKDGIVALKEDE
jgi:hypothetical protein